MNDLIVKNVDVLGDSIMAAKDEEGNVWAGVSYFCNALGMTKGQKDRQVTNVQKDEALKRGCLRLEAGVLDSSNETIALRIDYIPLWLAKITITEKTRKEHPELADKLLEYQLRAKDILADAFMPKHPKIPQSPLELLELHYEAIKQVDGKVNEIRTEFEKFKQEIPIFGEECSNITDEVKVKVRECLGGKDAPAYQDKQLHRKLYRDIYTQTNRMFGVKKYKLIHRNQISEYINAVKDYTPPIGIQSEIDSANSQMKLDI